MFVGNVSKHCVVFREFSAVVVAEYSPVECLYKCPEMCCSGIFMVFVEGDPE